MVNDQNIKNEAEKYAKRHRKFIAEKLTDVSKYLPEKRPISVFMAGSPGAGKTEYSKSFIGILEKGQRNVIRIDGDELRQLIPGYIGTNSALFNGSVSLIVEKIHDLALKNKQTFILDGTLSKYDKAITNINRSLSKQRIVFIFYVYQTPEVAWKFTQAREKSEGRNIPKDAFIEQFINSRETIIKIHKEFGDRISIFFIKKNFETHEVEEVGMLGQNKTTIDQSLERSYTKDELEKLL